MAAFPSSRRTVVLALAAAAAALAGGIAAASTTVRGNGVKRSEARNLTGFSGIVMAVPGQLQVRLGAAESVTVEADENILPLIETTVSGGTLRIRVAPGQNIEAGTLRIVVQAMQLDRLALAGSGSIAGDGLKGARLKVDLSGSGDLDLQRSEIDELTVAVSGSSNVRLAGKARALKVSLAGSGNLVADALRADDARISIAGAGVATVSARSSLNVSIAGSGTVRYQGDPKVERSIAGSGDVRRIGPLPS